MGYCAEFGRSRSNAVGVGKGKSQNLALPLWLGSVAGPREKKAMPNVGHCVQVGRSSSNDVGVGRGPKMLDHWGDSPPLRWRRG